MSKYSSNANISSAVTTLEMSRYSMNMLVSRHTAHSIYIFFPPELHYFYINLVLEYKTVLFNRLERAVNKVTVCIGPYGKIMQYT